MTSSQNPKMISERYHRFHVIHAGQHFHVIRAGQHAGQHVIHAGQHSRGSTRKVNMLTLRYLDFSVFDFSKGWLLNKSMLLYLCCHGQGDLAWNGWVWESVKLTGRLLLTSSCRSTFRDVDFSKCWRLNRSMLLYLLSQSDLTMELFDSILLMVAQGLYPTQCVQQLVSGSQLSHKIVNLLFTITN